MDPKGPAQPSLNTVYNTKGNAADKEPAEKQRAAQKPDADPEETPSERREPTTGGSQGKPQSLAQGIRGAPAGEEAKDSGATDESFKSGDVDGEQMRAPGEGEVSDAVTKGNKPGGGGEQKDLMSDIGRKTEEQKGARKEEKGQRDIDEGREGAGAGGVDVKKALDGRGKAVGE